MPSFKVPYRGEIWVLQQESAKEMCSFQLRVFKFDKKAKQFAKQTQNYINISLPGTDVKVIEFSCIIEEDTGLKQPCLLLVQRNSELDATIHFFFLVDYKVLKQIASYRHRDLALCQDFFLSDGPSVSWLSKNKFHFLQWNSNSHNLKYSSFTAKLHCEHLALLWSGKTIIEDDLLSIAHSRQGLFLANAKNGLVSSDKIIPSIYFSIVTCLHVNKCQPKLRYSNGPSQEASANTNVLDVYIGTSRSQLIRFDAGKMISCCQLPFDNPSFIEIIQVGNDTNHVVVQSEEGNVCLINPTQNKTLSEWTNKCMVLIDDFLNNGTDQVCLLQESAHIDQIFKGFVLCNFNGVNIASDQKPLSGECSLDKTSNSESLHSTIQALRARLQTCNAYFYEVRTMCNNKKAMIGKTCKTLQRLTGISETQENFNTSSLVCLIGDDTYEEKPKDVCKQQSPEVTPIDIWQRVISDKWVIAVEFKYTDKSNISDVTLSMVSSTKDYLKSSCEPKLQSQILRPGMLVHKQEILKPPSKRQKLDEIDQNSGVVTMVTTIPTFSKESRFTGLLVLSWTCCHDNEVTSRYVSCCGYVHLDIDQLISGDLSISGRKSVAGTNQDLIALKAISIQTMVSFNHISTPSNVISVLQRELGLVPISDITAAGSKEILLKACNVTGLLEGVAMLVDCSNDCCIVRLFTRNENQVYIIISRLRHALPADVTIHVRQAINGSSDSQFHMQNQLDHVKSDIQKTLLNKQQTLSKELDDSKCNVTKIGTIRSRFEERRKVFSFASRHPVKKL